MKKNYSKNINLKFFTIISFLKTNYDNIFYKIYPEYPVYFIKFAFFFVENFPLFFWFIGNIKYNKILLFYTFFIIIFFFYFFISKIKFFLSSLRDYYLLNSYYQIFLKINTIYFIFNPRGFINYTFLLKYAESPVSRKKSQELYASNLDFLETRQIYGRINQYLNILNTRYTTGKYVKEEKEILYYQINFVYKILADLKRFYRTFNHIEADWMKFYDFKEKFEDYVQACKNCPKWINEKLQLINTINPTFEFFRDNFLIVLKAESSEKEILLLKNYLSLNYNFKLNDLENSLSDIGNIDMKLVNSLHVAFSDLQFYSNNKMSKLLKLNNFKECFSTFERIFYLNNKIDISRYIIFFYLKGVDIILQDILNSVVKPLTIHKRFIILSEFKANQMFKKELLMLEELKKKILNIKLKILNFFFQFFTKLLNKSVIINYLYTRLTYIFNIIWNFEYNYKNFKKVILKFLED